jgi:ribosomal protein L37AE/L43A
MAHPEKTTIICPVCGKTASKISPIPNLIYQCDSCGFASTDRKCIDISLESSSYRVLKDVI